MDDMLEVLKWRLGQNNCVSPEDVPAAALVMRDKSKGEFIYVKYAFEELGSSRWTLAQLEAHMPDGLSCMFSRVVQDLHRALRNDCRLDLLDLLQHKILPALVVSRDPLTVAELAWVTRGELEEVQLLVTLLGNLFPCRVAGKLRTSREAQNSYIRPYHKSVLDWLSSSLSGDFQIDSRAGHLCFAQCCHTTMTTLEPLGQERQAPDISALKAMPIKQAVDLPVGTMYMLRHAVAHACLAQDAGILEATLLGLHLWQAIYTAGYGASVLGDLVQLASATQPESSALVEDVIRWLRIHDSYLMKYPRAVLQLACDAPIKSLLAQHARGLLTQPPAQLIVKEDDWPACLVTLSDECALHCVVISPSGQMCASGNDAGCVRLWDLATGQCRAVMTGHTDAVMCVVISLDSKSLISGSKDHNLRLWDMASGRCLSTLVGHEDRVTAVAISPDGATIVSSSNDKTIRLWSYASGECMRILKGHDEAVNCLTITSEGGRAVSGSNDKTLRIWDLASGLCMSTLLGHDDSVKSICLSTDGTTIASASRDSTVRLWDIASLACRAVLVTNGPDSLRSIAISPDGKLVVAGSWHDKIWVWDCASGACINTYTGHSDAVHGVAFSPCGNNIVSASLDGTIRIWKVVTSVEPEELAARQGLCSWVTFAAVMPNGQEVVTGSWYTSLRLRDLATGKCPASMYEAPGFLTCLSISPNGKHIVTGAEGSDIWLWDVEARQGKALLAGQDISATCAAISPDSITCVTGSKDNTVRVWDLASGQCSATFTGHTGPSGSQCPMHPSQPAPSGGWVKCVAVSPHGDIIASGAADATVRIWNLASRQCIRTLAGHMGMVTSVAFSPDGKTLVSASTDQTLRVWITASGQCSQTITFGSSNTRTVERLTVCTNNSTITAVLTDQSWKTSLRENQAIWCWDRASGRVLNVLDEFHVEAQYGDLGLGSAWGARGDGVGGSVCALTQDAGQVVAIRMRGGTQADKLIKIYMPPHMCADATLGVYISRDMKSVTVCCKESARVLCYKLA